MKVKIQNTIEVVLTLSAEEALSLKRLLQDIDDAAAIAIWEILPAWAVLEEVVNE